MRDSWPAAWWAVVGSFVYQYRDELFEITTILTIVSHISAVILKSPIHRVSHQRQAVQRLEVLNYQVLHTGKPLSRVPP